MTCEIFNDKKELVLSFKIDHFGERLVTDKSVTLSCIFPFEEGDVWTDEIIDRFAPLVDSNLNIGTIEMRTDNNILVGSYSKYDTCAGISSEYSPSVDRIEGVVTFTRVLKK